MFKQINSRVVLSGLTSAHAKKKNEQERDEVLSLERKTNPQNRVESRKKKMDFICIQHNGGQIKGLLAGHDCIKSQVSGSDCESPQQSLKFKTTASSDSTKLKNFTPCKVAV